VATLADVIEAIAHRHRMPLEDARTLAERRMAVAVERALAGDQTAFEQLRALEPFARRRFETRLAAGERADGVEVRVGSTGGRLP
jgi:hypothetical protein